MTNDSDKKNNQDSLPHSKEGEHSTSKNTDEPYKKKMGKLIKERDSKENISRHKKRLKH